MANPLFCSVCERVLRPDQIWHVLSVPNAVASGAAGSDEFTTCCAKDQRLTLAVPPKPGWLCLEFHSPTDALQAESTDSCRLCGVEKRAHPYRCQECEELVDLPCHYPPHSCGQVAKRLRIQLEVLQEGYARLEAAVVKQPRDGRET